MALLFGGSSGGGSAPNPTTTIQQQAQLSEEAAREQARLNRVNEITPLGSTTFSRTPPLSEEAFQLELDAFEASEAQRRAEHEAQFDGIGGGSGLFASAPFLLRAANPFIPGTPPNPNNSTIAEFTRTTSLDPISQATLEAQQNLGLGLTSIAAEQVGRVSDTIGQPLDFSGLPAAPQADEAARSRIEDALFSRQTSRLDPRFEDEQSRLDTLLANQGIQRGSETFSSEQERLSRQQNDALDLALSNAISGAAGEQSRLFGLEQSARNQGLTELLTQRNQPINDIGALLSQSQLNIPNFGAIPQVGVAPPDVLGAQALSLNQQNANLQRQQQLQNNLFGLGGSLGAAAILSDRRTKRNIHKVGELANGLNFYSFNYWFSDDLNYGVMADEVKKVNPGAVVEIDGVDHVYYWRL